MNYDYTNIIIDYYFDTDIKDGSYMRKLDLDNALATRPLLSRLALHAYSISFIHPTTNEQVSFIAPYQKDMDSTRKQLAKLFGFDPIEQI